jgi:hypothetical protein
MDMDFGTLCLLGIFLIVGFMLMSRMFGGNRGGGYVDEGTDFSQRGPVRPTVDSPEVQSRGAFGRPAGRSGFGSSFRNLGGGLRRRSGGGGLNLGGGRADNPEVKSRGSFGRSKR